jgi:hypothetical protein
MSNIDIFYTFHIELLLSFIFIEGDESQERNDLQENVFTPHSIDSVRLTNFLQQAGQVGSTSASWTGRSYYFSKLDR